MANTSHKDKLLVKISKSKPNITLAKLSKIQIIESNEDPHRVKSTESLDSQVKDGMFPAKDMTFLLATEDRGRKDFDTINLSKPKKDGIVKKKNSSIIKDKSKHSEGEKHIIFTEEGLKLKDLDKSDAQTVSLEESGVGHSTTSSSTMYYVNYEGRLSLKSRKSYASKMLQSQPGAVEIVLSIIYEIISTLGEGSIPDDHSMTFLQGILSAPTSALHSTTFVCIKDLMEQDRINANIEIERHLEQSNISKVMGSVINKLGLPITVCESKPHLDYRVKFDRIMSEAERVSVKDVPVDTSESECSRPTSSAEEDPTVRDPFEITWCFGFNPDVPIINLATDDRSVIMFAIAQFAVLYNFHEDTMQFMQGHRNTISCIASDCEGSFLVTADSGLNSRVIIWDSRPCVLQVLEEVHPMGTQLTGLSRHGEYLVTISPYPRQYIQMWVWNTEQPCPVAAKHFSEGLGKIRKLTMNPARPEEFALTLENGVSFGILDVSGVEHDLVLNTHQLSKLGSFTDTTFLKEQHATALSCTSSGYVVVWVEEDSPQRKKMHEKHVRLHLGAITHIEAVDRLVAIATSSGNVSFFNPNLTLVHWSSKLQMGPLVSLSFNVSPQEDVTECLHKSHTSCAISWRQERNNLFDSSLQANPLRIRHFVTSTRDGRIAYINSSSGIPKYLFYPSSAFYTAMDVIPESNFLCAGTSDGRCVLIDTSDFKVKVTQNMNVPENMCQAVSVLRYSPSGALLACGMYTGDIWLLNPLLLTPRPNMPIVHSLFCITHFAFSSDSEFLAVSDSSLCVAVYSLQGIPALVGQYQAHSKPILSIFFVNNGTELKLFTLGADRNIVEFEVCGIYDLEFKYCHRVEQCAIPCCIVPYPPSNDHFIMINSEFKFKLLDSQTLKCCKTLQAPDLGFPIKFIECFPTDTNYLVIGTSHHIAVQLMPVDGNPYKALAYLASPTPIICCRIHPGGKYLFTISENCSAILMWKINSAAVDEFCASGGDGLEPFMSLLEGGKGGWREKDLKEFFMVGQFVHQGEKPSVVRTLASTLPVRVVASVFQALGFYPTKHQVKNILYELAGADDCPLQGLPRKHVDFDEFLKLYVNHRSCRELPVSDLHQAFRHFYEGIYFTDRDASKLESEPVFVSEPFVENLMVTGEEMAQSELYSDLRILAGNLLDPGRRGEHEMRPLPFLPKEITFEVFTKDLLGFECIDDHF